MTDFDDSDYVDADTIDSSLDVGIDQVDTTSDDHLGELHGAPESSSDEWFLQYGDGYCVPASITQVISEVTGQPLPDESAVVAAMQKMGLEFDPSHGMTMDEGLAVLEYLGVDAEVESGLSLVDLETYLDEGRSLILGVDSGDIWGEPDPAGTTGEADHALVITAIDQDRGYVVLSDPGNPDGNQDVVPLADFVEAWSGSDNSAIVTTEPTQPTTEIPAQPGPVLIPVTVNADHPVADVQSYTVVAGDTLWDIAERVYGDGSQFMKIAEASGIANPDLIQPGQVLTIPE
jgi:hypothetical protein